MYFLSININFVKILILLAEGIEWVTDLPFSPYISTMHVVVLISVIEIEDSI